MLSTIAQAPGELAGYSMNVGEKLWWKGDPTVTLRATTKLFFIKGKKAKI